MKPWKVNGHRKRSRSRLTHNATREYSYVFTTEPSKLVSKDSQEANLKQPFISASFSKPSKHPSTPVRLSDHEPPKISSSSRDRHGTTSNWLTLMFAVYFATGYVWTRKQFFQADTCRSRRSALDSIQNVGREGTKVPSSTDGMIVSDAVDS